LTSSTLEVLLSDHKGARAPTYREEVKTMSAKMRRTAKRLPIACELSEGGQRSRREEISRELFSGCKDMRELEDGYEFVFPGGEEWIERLARFVAEERECCRFFAFELLFEPELGPVSLRMRGPAGTKEFLAGQFTEDFAREHFRKHG
jgi:hypothetical protein